ncbi:MAG: DUF5666 domain-containing protein, partial [Burkholderiaceae bacterium]|nr:DUF5666 domain-containing protein [Burkholderiaceae bacterium]
YDDSQAVVAFDVDPRAEAPATIADLKVGMQVEGSVREGKLTKVFVRATVIGPVQSIDLAASSFKVVGQTVKVIATGDGRTMFEGASGLADLKVDDWVEVHGTIDADKNVVATRVEVKLPTGEIKVRAGGIATNVDDSAKTFKLGDLTVDYKNAVIKPDGAKIENDALVFVFSDRLPAGNTLTAKAVRVATPSLEGRRFIVGGLVTDASADGKTFKVNGIAIDASNAELKGGQNPTFADIRNMALVRVEGTLSGTGAAVVLKATRVWIVPASESRRIVLAGQVTDFVSAASFKVRGTPVDADMATFKNGAKDDLKDGAFVLVKGRIDGDVVRADEVIFGVPPKDVPFRLLGVVKDFDPAAKTFTLLGIPMRLADMAKFEGGTLADFGNGDLVEVRGAFDGTAFVVTEVRFRSGMPPVIYAEGVISGVTATGFQLNGATFKVTSTTQIVNGPLANGQRVEVVAHWAGGEVVADRVEVQMPGATARLMGPITDFVSKADFKVQGVAVDASAATFENGAEADLANGRFVRVIGVLDAGTVKASSVKFLR